MAQRTGSEVGPSMDVFVLISMLGIQIWRRYLTFYNLLAGCRLFWFPRTRGRAEGRGPVLTCWPVRSLGQAVATSDPLRSPIEKCRGLVRIAFCFPQNQKSEGDCCFFCSFPGLDGLVKGLREGDISFSFSLGGCITIKQSSGYRIQAEANGENQ